MIVKMRTMMMMRRRIRIRIVILQAAHSLTSDPNHVGAYFPHIYSDEGEPL
jgi:hypothetical protein